MKFNSFFLLFLFIFNVICIPPTTAKEKPILLKDVIALKEIGLSDQDILQALKKSKAKFHLNKQKIEKLRKSGIGDKVIDWMKQSTPPTKITVKKILSWKKAGKSTIEILQKIKDGRPQSFSGDDFLKLIKSGVHISICYAMKKKTLNKSDLINLAKKKTSSSIYEMLFKIIDIKYRPNAYESLELLRGGVPKKIVKWLIGLKKKTTKIKEASSNLYTNKKYKFTLSYPHEWSIKSSKKNSPNFIELKSSLNSLNSFSLKVEEATIKDKLTMRLLLLQAVSDLTKKVKYASFKVRIFEKNVPGRNNLNQKVKVAAVRFHRLEMQGVKGIVFFRYYFFKDLTLKVICLSFDKDSQKWIERCKKSLNSLKRTGVYTRKTDKKLFKKVRSESIKSSNEMCAMRSMRTIFQAEQQFKILHKKTVEGVAYYATLKELGKANLIDYSLASGQNSGYIFKVNVIDNGGRFTCTAIPKSKKEGSLSFFVNNNGKLTYTEDGSIPNAKSKEATLDF